MNKKQLAIALSKLEDFDDKNVKLEQYKTDSELAALLLWKAFMNNDIKEKIIADLGCGNGILGLGALFLEAKKVYFVDVDEKVIELVKENTKDFKNKKIFNLDVKEFDKKVDTIIMNPPFGVQNEHADQEFLLKAFETGKKVYSMHKIESKDFIEKLCENNNWKVNGIEKVNFIIRKSYKFHKKENYSVRVGIWELEKL